MGRAREDRIGRYELLIELGHGGMAELFLGRLHGAGGFAKLVAIKRILPHLAKDELFTAMFLNEGRIASQLSHPNICQVFELDDSDGDLFLAMEYLDGVGFDQLLAALSIPTRSQTPPLALAAGVLAQAADGLHYAHTLRDAEGNATPVVHRDVSPQNLFVTVDGTCKVLDFGVSKMMTDGPRTKTGLVKGKLPYMAPEQIRGEPVDARTDVFSLGVCLWEALAGERLYERTTDFLIWKAVTEEDAPLITSRWPHCPLAVEGLLRKTLAREASDRLGSAREFAEQLREAVPQLASATAIGDTVRAACAERLATRAKQVATAIGKRRSIPADRLTPTPSDGPAPDPAMSAAVTLQSGRSAAITMDDKPAARDPLETTDAGAVAVRLRDKSHVVERVDAARPADPTLDHLEVARKHNRVGLIIGAIAAVLVLVVVIFIATQSSSTATPSPTKPATDPAHVAVPVDAVSREITGEPVVVDAAPVKPPPPPAVKPEAKAQRPPPRIETGSATPKPDLLPNEPAFLSIASEPYAAIYVDGKKLGDTPLYRQTITAGRHVIRAVRADGREKSFTIHVAPGKAHNAGKLAW